jgi:hypothetical protein
MNRKFGMNLILCGVLGWSVGAARAQETAPPPPPPDVIFAGADADAIGGFVSQRIEVLGFEGMHGGKVVTGAPFSAVAVTETTQTLADGNHIARKTQTNLFRDSQGRVRREVTLEAFGPLAASGQMKSFVSINDPVAGTHYVLHPDTKTAEQLPGPGGRIGAAIKGHIEGKLHAHVQEAVAEGTLAKEDLGTQTMEGVSAQGTRFTHVIPAGEIGNEKPITVVREVWYSNDLQMVLMTKRSDPRFGETTYTLSNLQRSEPDTSLFKVPSDYTVTQGPGPGKVLMREFHQGTPPPPEE